MHKNKRLQSKFYLMSRRKFKLFENYRNKYRVIKFTICTHNFIVIIVIKLVVIAMQL